MTIDPDDAVLRRMPVRIQVPLPDFSARRSLMASLLEDTPHRLSSRELDDAARCMDGYSNSDIKHVARDAAMNAIRELEPANIVSIDQASLRPISKRDVDGALVRIRPTVSPSTLAALNTWNAKYGTSS